MWLSVILPFPYLSSTFFFLESRRDALKLTSHCLNCGRKESKVVPICAAGSCQGRREGLRVGNTGRERKGGQEGTRGWSKLCLMFPGVGYVLRNGEKSFFFYTLYSTLPILLLTAWPKACKIPKIRLYSYYGDAATMRKVLVGWL